MSSIAAQVAERFGVSERTVHLVVKQGRCRDLIREECEKTFQRLESGELTVSRKKLFAAAEQPLGNRVDFLLGRTPKPQAIDQVEDLVSRLRRAISRWEAGVRFSDEEDQKIVHYVLFTLAERHREGEE